MEDSKEVEKKSWQEIWQENYEGKGACEELEDRLKFLEKKTGEVFASYLPWAVVQRIFMFQGGEIEVIDFPQTAEVQIKSEDESEIPKFKRVIIKNTIVEKDSAHLRDEYDDNGVAEPIYIDSFFVNVKVKWKGREHIERYPLLGTTNNPLFHWTQADLNRAVQRAKVKAIAIVSGIGYKLFEDGDLQFEDDKKAETTKKAEDLKNVSSRKKDKKPDKKPEKKPEKEEETEVDETTETEVDETTETETEEKEISQDVPDRTEMENEIKTAFLKGGKQKEIKSFLTEKDTKMISDLSLEDITTLYQRVRK